MGVNSAFTRIFTSQFVVGSRIVIAMLAIIFIASSFVTPSDRDIRAKQVNLMIRQIGHRLLLQAGDSTSRVLPVTEITEGTFLLRFENEFVFSHDSLMALAQSLLPKTEFPSGYTVTVEDCMKGDIVYGFLVSNTASDLTPCRGRREPPGCYTIEFAFPDFYENITKKEADHEKERQKKADIDQQTEELKSVKVEAQKADLNLEELKTTTFDDNINRLTEEPKLVNVDPKEVNPKAEGFKRTTFNYPFITLVFGGMALLLCVTFLIGRFRKPSAAVPLQDENDAAIKESVPESAALGKFLFDVKDQRLLLGSEVICLTDKECRILELLYKNFGELIPRETLMQKIWIDEGVITGRSLDMFVSKLRKKLSSDPELRISNVHGKGYKLEIHGM
jgi:hypothetical protein